MKKIFSKKSVASSVILMFLASGIFVPAGFTLAQTYSYPSLYIYKTVDRTYVQSGGGDILTYTIHYQNTGNARTTNTIITDDFDDTKLILNDGSDGVSSGGSMSWNLGNLEPGAYGSKYFKVQIKSGLSSGTNYIYNKASISSTETGSHDSNTATTQYLNNSSSNNSIPTVDIKANGSDGPITVQYNTPITLSWNSSNATSCYASGDWSGSKSLSASEYIGYVTSNKTYTINCSGPNGYVSDLVTVNVNSYNNNNYYNYNYNQSQYAAVPTTCTSSNCSNITIEKTGLNISDGGKQLSHTTTAHAGDVVSFQIKVTGSNNNSSNITVTDSMPTNLTFRGNLIVDGTPIVGGNGNLFSSGLNLGYLAAGQTRVISYEAQVSSSVSSGVKLKNIATAYSGNLSASDNALICIPQKKIITIPTYVSTGITDNILFDSFIIPLAISLLILFLLKTRIIKINQWRDLAKERYGDYKSKKILSLKISQIRAREFN